MTEVDAPPYRGTQRQPHSAASDPSKWARRRRENAYRAVVPTYAESRATCADSFLHSALRFGRSERDLQSRDRAPEAREILPAYIPLTRAPRDVPGKA